MEISHSQFQTTDFNYGLIEGSQGLDYKQKSENEPVKTNVFATLPFAVVQTSRTKKKKKPNNRFNISDNEFLDEMLYIPETEQPIDENLFALPPKPNPAERISRTLKEVAKHVPVLNSVILKTKSIKLQRTLNNLNEINQNVDNIMTSSVPYGEEDKKYSDITKNLSDASNLLEQAKREIE